MFTPRIPVSTLAQLCRALSTMLESGIHVRKAILLCSKKSVHPKTRSVMRDVADRIQEGSDLTTAFSGHTPFFPNLFVDMMAMAEHAGALPEVLRHLADHYDKNIQMRRQFIQSITWPAIQLTLAILIIALLIVVIGWVSGGAGADISHLTFGLKGTTGAGIWLTVTFGSIAALLFGVKALQKADNLKQMVDPVLMQVPVLGHCLRCFGIARFSWAYFLTQQTGMPVRNSIQSSCRATANGAFLRASDDIVMRLMEGETVTESLAESGLFPADYIEMVAVAEEAGTVPESLQRLSPQFEDDAQRSLKALTVAMSVAVWVTVAAFIVFFVFRIALWYIGMLNDAAGQAM